MIDQLDTAGHQEGNVYRGTLFRHKYLGALICILFTGIVCSGMLTGRLDFAALVACLGIVAYCRLRFRYIRFDADSMVYVSWLQTHVVCYSQIIRVRRADEFPWPVNHYHGPCEFKVEAGRDSFWLSLLWFQPEAYRALKRVTNFSVKGL